MKLFKLENYQVVVDPVAFTLLPFKKLLDRDKTKGKSTVFKEMAFVYHYASLTSDFNIITDETSKVNSIKQRVGLGDKWTIDADVQEAINLFRERTITPEADIYLNAMRGAVDTGKYLAQAGTLLRERDDNGKYITTPPMISASLKAISQIIKDLQILEMETIKKQENMVERTKGSQTLAMFEDATYIIPREQDNNDEEEEVEYGEEFMG